jgi:hypothetical protein
MNFAKLIPRFIRRRAFFEPWMFRVPGIFEASLGRLGLGVELINEGDGAEHHSTWSLYIHILPLLMFVHLPLPRRSILDAQGRAVYGEREYWGVAAHFERDMSNVFFRWGQRVVIWDFPFVNHIHQRHEVQRPDGSWVPYVGSWEERSPERETDGRGRSLKDPDGRYTEAHTYRYTLRSGDIQEVLATCFIERLSWRPKWLAWTSFFEWSRASIDVSFSREVGERAGSWKGGCTGCSWEMRSNESIESALRRMENERKFR